MNSVKRPHPGKAVACRLICMYATGDRKLRNNKMPGEWVVVCRWPQWAVDVYGETSADRHAQRLCGWCDEYQQHGDSYFDWRGGNYEWRCELVRVEDVRNED